MPQVGVDGSKLPRPAKVPGSLKDLFDKSGSGLAYGALTPGMAASFTQQLASYRGQFESQLAAFKGQRKNIGAGFRAQKAAIEQQTVGNIVKAEGQAVERGVLGGSADVKQRVGVLAEGAAATEAARLDKTMALSDIAQQKIQAYNNYILNVAGVDLQKQTALAESIISGYASDMVVAADALAAKDIVRDGNFGSIVKQLGETQLGVPYVYGVKDAYDAFDCSGFTSWIYEKATGKVLPHNANEQMNQLEKVDRSQLQVGDLVFFWFPNSRGIARGNASHVGIYIGKGRMIHASLSGGAIIEADIPWDSMIQGGRAPQDWDLLRYWYG